MPVPGGRTRISLQLRAVVEWRTANWYRGAFGSRNPWGPRPVAQVMGAESEVERQLSTTIMRGGPKPRLQSLRKQ